MKENFLIFIDFVGKLYKNRYMIKSMALRDLRAQYVGSVFGILWAVINPLAEVFIYSIIFGTIFKSTAPQEYHTKSFVLFLFGGLVPWQFFAQSINTSSGVILNNKNLVTKAVGFPSEVLVIVNTVSGLITQLISVALLLAIVGIYQGGLFPATPVILVYLFLAAVFSVGLGWIISSLNVFLRDISKIIGVIMMGWLFFTPIFYAPNLIPEKYVWLVRLNPMYYMVEGYRQALFTGSVLPLRDLFYFAVVSFITLGVGGIFYRKLKPAFAEVL